MSNDISMTRGETHVFTAAVTGLGQTGLSGSTIYFAAKRDVRDTTSYIAKDSTGADVVITQQGNQTTPGLINVTIRPADTSGLPSYATALVYDIVAVDAQSQHITLASGKLTVSPDVDTAQ